LIQDAVRHDSGAVHARDVQHPNIMRERRSLLWAFSTALASSRRRPGRLTDVNRRQRCTNGGLSRHARLNATRQDTEPPRESTLYTQPATGRDVMPAKPS